ncbi:MAG TPA: hypothetical protein VER97_03090 [Geodermatophilus sp.]|nr:hypothetical protein [Geodermatophilus sp.]
MGSEPAEDVLVLPPIPLATGRRLVRDDDGRPLAITGVELVVSTEDGGEHRIALVPRHGAWWAPPDR